MATTTLRIEVKSKVEKEAEPLLWQAPQSRSLQLSQGRIHQVPQDSSLEDDYELPEKPPLVCPDCKHRGHVTLREAQAVAFKGNPKSQLHIADLYQDIKYLRTMLEISIKPSEALKCSAAWLRLAAKQGLSVAECKLGRYYHEIRKDYSRAFYWHNKAALQGDIESQL